MSVAILSTADAGVVLDNTAGGTKALSGSGHKLHQFSVLKVFTVGSSDTELTQQVLGLSGTSAGNLTWDLYNVDASNIPIGASLASDAQAYAAGTNVYRTFTTGGTLASYTLQAGQTYGLAVKSDTEVIWSAVSPGASYTELEGFTFETTRVLSPVTGGWELTGTLHGWSMTTSGGASGVPEPTSLAMLGLCAAGAAFRSRRRLNASVKRALRRV